MHIKNLHELKNGDVCFVYELGGKLRILKVQNIIVLDGKYLISFSYLSHQARMSLNVPIDIWDFKNKSWSYVPAYDVVVATNMLDIFKYISPCQRAKLYCGYMEIISISRNKFLLLATKSPQVFVDTLYKANNFQEI